VETKNKNFIKVILFLLGFSNLLAQESAIEILQKVKDNSTLIENAKYKFIITSEFENNLLPINGVFYIKDENYFIDTEEIDQIYDGDKFYTIIHENQEIIVSDKDNTFFNFTPNQIFNYFLNGFELQIEKLLNNSYLIIAENNQEEDIFYSIVINATNLSIEKIEMIEKKSNVRINSFLTLTYDYNLIVPLSLFKFDINKYKNYLIVLEN
jgi:outer membrane lipoprotein-sorting protein